MILETRIAHCFPSRLILFHKQVIFTRHNITVELFESLNRTVEYESILYACLVDGLNYEAGGCWCHQFFSFN